MTQIEKKSEPVLYYALAKAVLYRDSYCVNRVVLTEFILLNISKNHHKLTMSDQMCVHLILSITHKVNFSLVFQ